MKSADSEDTAGIDPEAPDTASPPTARGPVLEAIDCEVAEIALAARQLRTLDRAEADALEAHLATCARCRAATADGSESRWLVRLAREDFEAGPQLPIVDPDVFIVERELASGGMGRVLLATDRRLGRQVALKEILEPGLKLRFEREALITAHLQHPAIVPIYEAGTWPDGVAFYAMRLVAGKTLHEAIDEATTLGARLALLHHFTAMVEAIAYAHERRIIHRDLKSTNVLVGDLGDTVVIDWGLAKHLDDEPEAESARPAIPRSGPDLTRAGAVMGTPGFMAPEQARGESTDERADVFSLGAILYTLLAGSPPYLGEGDPAAAITRAAAGPPRPIAELAPEAPIDLRVICERAMAHRPEVRYPTARELAIELRRFEAGQLLARPYTLRELVVRWFRRHRALVLGGAVSLVAVILIGVFAILGITRSRAAERTARQEAETALVQAREASATAIAGEAAALEEQARVALARGDREPALVLLHQALSRGRDTPALRYLLAIVLRDRELVDRIDDDTTVVPNRVVTHDGVYALDTSGGVYRGTTRLFDTTPSPVAAEIFGDFLVIQDEDRSLGCWNLEARTLAWRHPGQALDDRGGELHFIAATKQVVFVARDAKVATVRSLATGALVKELAFPSEIRDVAVGGGSIAATIAIATNDEVVSIYDDALALTRRLKLPLRADVAVLDSDHVITAAGPIATIWNSSDARDPGIALVHDLVVRDIAVELRSDLIVTTTRDGTIRVWSSAGLLLSILPARSDTRPEPVMSRDGQTLVVDAGAHLELRSLPGVAERIDLPGFFEVRRRDRGFAAVDGNRLRTFRAPTFGRLEVYESRGSTFVGDKVLTLDAVSTTIHDPQRWTRDHRFDEIPPGIWHVSPPRLLSDPRMTASRDSHIALVDLTGGSVLAKLQAEGPIALSPAGTRIALADETQLRIIDGDGTLLRTLAIAATQLSFLDDHTLIVAHDERTSLVDTETLAITPFAATRVHHPIHVSADRHVVLLGREITIHEPTGKLVATLPASAQHVRTSRDARVISAQHDNNEIEIFDLSRAPPSIATVPAATPNAFALSADGSRLFTGNGDGTVRVFEAATGRQLEARQIHRRRVHTIQLRPDGNAVLADVADPRKYLDEIEDETATLLDVALDTHSLAEITEIVGRSGWTFVDGIVRGPPR